MSLRLTTATLLLAPVLAACSSVPAEPPPEALIGSWTYCDDGGGTHIFAADGTYTYDSTPGEEHDLAGTFTADEATLLMTGTDSAGADFETEMTYYVTSTQVHRAMLPEAEHEGMIGVWTGFKRHEDSAGSDDYQVTLELRADNTGHYTGTTLDGAGDVDGEGTWGLGEDQFGDVPVYRFSMMLDGLLYTRTFHFVEGQALGMPTFCKVNAN